MRISTWAHVTTMIAHQKEQKYQMIIGDHANKNYLSL